MHPIHTPRMPKHSIHWAMQSLFCGCSEVGKQHGGHKARGQLVPNPNHCITNGTHGHQEHQLASPTASKDTTDINNVEPQDVDVGEPPGTSVTSQCCPERPYMEAHFRNHSSWSKLSAAAKTEPTTGMHMALPTKRNTSVAGRHSKS